MRRREPFGPPVLVVAQDCGREGPGHWSGTNRPPDEDSRLNINRQNGRRRGRGGGQRPPSNSPSPGNRQDNRSRGNAAQLHEKYKALARDSQMSGDRVQTEYYLQFADHYFRVLNENRPRFEEQRPRRDDFMSDDEDDGEENLAANDVDDGDDRDERQDRQPRYERQERPERQERSERQERPDRQERGERQARPDRQPRPEREASEARDGEEREPRQDREPREQRPEREARPDRETRNVGELRPRRERPRRDRAEQEEVQEDAGEARISLDSLPPAISADVVEAKPRRRTRRPRPEDGDSEIAPAA